MILIVPEKGQEQGTLGQVAHLSIWDLEQMPDTKFSILGWVTRYRQDGPSITWS